MTRSHIPREYWDWRCTALVLIVAATPVLSLSMLVTHQPEAVAAAANLNGVMLAPPALLAAACLYASWRIGGEYPLAWLSTGATVIGLQGLAMAALELGDSAETVRQGFWMAVSDAGILVVLLVTACCFGRRFPGDPNVVGVIASLGLAVLRLVAVTRLPTVDIHALSYRWWMFGFLLIVLPLLWLVGRTRSIAAWARWRLVAATVLFGLAHLITYLDQPHRTLLGSALSLLAAGFGTVLLAVAAVALLRQTITEGWADRDGLRMRLDEMEDDVRRDRGRIHEINSIVAGVLSATRLLREAPRLDDDHRRMLGDMVQEELERLERLLRDPILVPAARQPLVDLDATIRNLALSHQARGHQVRWLPSGARVAAHPDDVTEVLNILLDNAAKHGAAEAQVSVEPEAGGVRILVSDSGPGIPPEMRSRLFEWGVRGSGSQGQGIGLAIAEELARRQGGYLRLHEGVGKEGRQHGTTFVVGLPAAVGDSHGQQPHLA
jgi:signal transduction histidine kinase